MSGIFSDGGNNSSFNEQGTGQDGGFSRQPDPRWEDGWPDQGAPDDQDADDAPFQHGPDLTKP